MYDFLKIVKKWDSKLQRNVYSPTFEIKSNIKDLLVRGNKFYAIFNYNTNLWETDDSKAIELIDEQVREYVEEKESIVLREDPEHGPIIKRLADQSNLMIKSWHSFCEKDYRKEWDSRCQLDQKVIFSNTESKRSDYATKKLDYPLQESPTPAYDKLCSVLYLPSEVEKWEWFVGCALAGEQRKIQKMLIFYGEPGTGKSTIIDKVIFDGVFGGISGYASTFDAENLCGRDNFGTDFLEKDAILCTDGDAKMDIINSKATLNKIISHESVRVNAKYERAYTTVPNCLLIVGSNEPIQLAPNSGMNRRVIDVRPTGTKIPTDEYDRLCEQIPFEKSGIAWKCLQTYKRLGKHAFQHYIAEDMLNRTSPFQNFVKENYIQLKDGISLAAAYKMYTDYAEECNLKNVLPRYKFRDTLKLYFKNYDNMKFSEFKPEKIGMAEEPVKSIDVEESNWLELSQQKSIFDELYSHCPAQYEQDDVKHPLKYSWANCKTTLEKLDTSKIHFVKVPVNLIVIDLDIKGDDKQKDLKKNLEMAKLFPPTYAEVSKSGGGIHLHYIYTGGDPDKLNSIYGDNIEIKVFTGGSALRRKLTLCNNIPIAEISSGLPLKEDKKGGNGVIDWKGFKNTTRLKNFIVACLLKKHNPGYTRTEMNFLKQELDKWYESGETYDVRDFEMEIFDFACNSNNSSQYCQEVANSLHLCSKDIEEQNELENFETEEYKKMPIVIFDCEIVPSYAQAKALGVKIPDYIPEDTPALFLINYSFLESDDVIRMINPKPHEVEKLFHYRLIGFNNRAYDNHMLWARSQGYTSEELFNLSQKLINKQTAMKARFSQAYNISYTDIYDYVTNDNKMSLKKWEIKLKVKHMEWNRPWDEPVAEKDWEKLAEYCDNDVITTKLVFKKTYDEYEARCMLAELAGGTPNDTTNKLSTKFVKGDSDHLELVYTDFTTGKQYGDGVPFTLEPITLDEYNHIWEDEMKEKPKNINHFPSYHLVRFEDGTLHNMYRGIDVGRGGLVIAYPGMYGPSITKDVASMHPSSIEALNLFGKQTKRYSEIKQTRIFIKHGDIESAKKMFNGALIPFLEKEDLNLDVLSTAFKLVLNSFYGMTSSPSDYFEAKDSRNVNNIVALRGALVMKTLHDDLISKGFKVIHIKTDSIKVNNPTDEILNYIDEFGLKYGYIFEVEHTWERLCLKDKANYIGRHGVDDPLFVKNPEKSERKFPNRWDATGDYFANPYVFKSLFSHQEITIDDMAEIINVKEGSLHIVYDEGQENEGDIFIGRVGQFTPVTQGGGSLYRVKEGKRYAASGTKGYKWLETETVVYRNDLSIINRDYYISKCNDAIDVLKSFGDYEWFVNPDEITVDNFIDYPSGYNEKTEAIPFN